MWVFTLLVVVKMFLKLEYIRSNWGRSSIYLIINNFQTRMSERIIKIRENGILLFLNLMDCTNALASLTIPTKRVNFIFFSFNRLCSFSLYCLEQSLWRKSITGYALAKKGTHEYTIQSLKHPFLKSRQGVQEYTYKSHLLPLAFYWLA